MGANAGLQSYLQQPKVPFIPQPAPRSHERAFTKRITATEHTIYAATYSNRADHLYAANNGGGGGMGMAVFWRVVFSRVVFK
jgi:hypothetical protein